MDSVTFIAKLTVCDRTAKWYFNEQVYSTVYLLDSSQIYCKTYIPSKEQKYIRRYIQRVATSMFIVINASFNVWYTVTKQVATGQYTVCVSLPKPVGDRNAIYDSGFKIK
jgi:hypothetical protein